MLDPVTIAGLAAAAALLVTLLLLRPWRVALSARGRADGDGWALAGGAELGPLSGSGAAARGVPPVLAAHLFGRRLLTVTAPRLPQVAKASLGAWWRRIDRFVDPLELLAFLIAETRRVSVTRVRLQVRGGLADPAATATVMGILATAAGVLAPLGTVVYDADWSGDTKGDLSLDLTVCASPLLCGVDALRFVLVNVHLRAPAGPAAAPQAS